VRFDVDHEMGVARLDPAAVRHDALVDALAVEPGAPGAVEIAEEAMLAIPGELEVHGGHLRIMRYHELGPVRSANP
jgi:hypothetical protein